MWLAVSSPRAACPVAAGGVDVAEGLFGVSDTVVGAGHGRWLLEVGGQVRASVWDVTASSTVCRES